MSIDHKHPTDAPSRRPFSILKPFRAYCQKILPLTYDDSMSYYELLCRVVEYLNLINENMENMNSDIDTMFDSFEDLQKFVDDTYNAIVDEINQFEQEMKTDMSNFKQEIRTAFETYKTELNKAFDDYKTQLNTDWNEFKTQMSQAYEEAITNLNNAFNSYKQETTAEFNRKFTNLSDDITNKFDDLNRLWSKKVDSLDSKYYDLSTDITNKFNDLSNTLKEYQNNYFKNLDVQKEIDDKLDSMVSDGTLQNLLTPTIVNMLTIIPVNNTGEMTNKNKMYLLRSSGMLYYWDGNNWESTGVKYGSVDVSKVAYVLPLVDNKSTKKAIEYTYDSNSTTLTFNSVRIVSDISSYTILEGEPMSVQLPFYSSLAGGSHYNTGLLYYNVNTQKIEVHEGAPVFADNMLLLGTYNLSAGKGKPIISLNGWNSANNIVDGYFNGFNIGLCVFNGSSRKTDYIDSDYKGNRFTNVKVYTNNGLINITQLTHRWSANQSLNHDMIIPLYILDNSNSDGSAETRLTDTILSGQDLDINALLYKYTCIGTCYFNTKNKVTYNFFGSPLDFFDLKASVENIYELDVNRGWTNGVISFNLSVTADFDYKGNYLYLDGKQVEIPNDLIYNTLDASRYIFYNTTTDELKLVEAYNDIDKDNECIIGYLRDYHVFIYGAGDVGNCFAV